MRLLILNVDRDDDLGRKTGIRAPIIGRERMLEAATALVIADPEEADANGMFAAIKEYDEIAARKLEYDAEEVFVGAVTGHIREGSMADNAIAQQIDGIIKETRCDAVILVSDGSEDEHVLPILKTRVKVNGIRRVVVKQARNLEGALFLFQRLLHDEKLQRRFFLPLALLLIAAGSAVLLRKPEVFVAMGLFLGAVYILIQVFSLNEPLGTLVTRLGEQVRAGKLSLLMSLVALGLVVFGGLRTRREVLPAGLIGTTRYTVEFAYAMYWWVVAAVCLILLGRGIDRYLRNRAVQGRHFEFLLFFLCAAMIGWGAVRLLDALTGAAPLGVLQLINLDFSTWVLFGGSFFFLGLLAHRYFQQLTRARGAGDATAPK